MARPVELMPLVCVKCSMPVPASPGQAAWVCANCQQGMYLDEILGLQAVQVNYQAGIAANQIGRPFWVAKGRVQLQRQTYGGSKADEAQAFWNQERTFFVPAYSLPLENLLEMGVKLLLRSPKLDVGAPARFMDVTLARMDVQAVAEFIVMAVEAERNDKLKTLELSLPISDPDLWILA